MTFKELLDSYKNRQFSFYRQHEPMVMGHVTMNGQVEFFSNITIYDLTCYDWVKGRSPMNEGVVV